MMKRTHLAVGVAISVPIILKFNLPVVAGLGVIGAIAPDWDFYIGVKHRTLTHSLLALMITTIPIIYLFDNGVGVIWGICYFSHMVLDSLTVMGVPFLYPFIKDRQGIRKFRTGQGEDYFIQLMAIYLTTLNFI